EVDGEDLPDVAGRVEHGHRARDAKAVARVELVRLRPRQSPARLHGAEERPLRGPVAVVLRATDEHARPVDDKPLLAQPDLAVVRKGVIDVDLHVEVAPGADEAIGGIAEADPR